MIGGSMELYLQGDATSGPAVTVNNYDIRQVYAHFRAINVLIEHARKSEGGIIALDEWDKARACIPSVEINVRY